MYEKNMVFGKEFAWHAVLWSLHDDEQERCLTVPLEETRWTPGGKAQTHTHSSACCLERQRQKKLECRGALTVLS